MSGLGGRRSILLSYRGLEDFGTMICAQCKIDKPTSDFYYRKTEQRYHPYCKRCHNVYTHERFKRRKLKAIAYKGGACVDCGETFHYSVFEFHHLDPTQKDLSGQQIKRWSWKRVETELDKCLLLCANCHRLRHWGDG